MNVRLRYNMPFTAGVYYSGEICMNHYTLVIRMTTNSTDATDHNVAFERIKYFVYNCLDSAVFISNQEQEQCQRLVNAGIKVVTMPGDPVDQLIGLMLYYKLNAIMEDRIIVDETEISSVLGEHMVYLHSDNETTDVGDPPAWWSNTNPCYNDFVTVSADKVVSMHANSAWRDLELNWIDPEVTAETGNIVVFQDFKPGNETK